MFLPHLISLQRPQSAVLEPEDIFGSSLGGVFADDLQNQHGDKPDTVILYQNSRYGQLKLKTADINGEEQRTKFAHYLWNAGVLVGELIGGRRITHAEDESAQGQDEDLEDDEFGWRGTKEWWVSETEEKLWNVQEETVLELGAGVGLGGIVSVLAGAKEVAISDYPATPILDTIKANVATNVPSSLKSRLSVEGHKWGSISTPFESTNAKRYTRVIAADCLWMPGEHEHLAQSMSHFLSYREDARVFVIAGFHTGRAKMAPFFEEVVPRSGLEIEEIFEMNANGARRPWAKERDGGREDFGERKKWLVLARLKRAS